MNGGENGAGEDAETDAETASDTEGRTITRRRMILGGGASLGAVGGGRALYNTVLGYGQAGMGTNLKDQDLAAVVSEQFPPSYDESIDGTRIRSTDTGIEIEGEETLRFDADGHDEAERVDAEYGGEGRISGLFADLSAFRRGEYAFEFSQPSAFFERVGTAEFRPGFLTAVRNNRDRIVDPELIERFVGADPADTAAVIDGLTAGFREHTRYDIPRYLAGSIEDNVILGAADLRQYFEDPVDFGALLEADTTGIFCWELVFRSIEALQALRPDQQSIPVSACYVSDRRHKHAFTGIMTAVRDDGELRFPMTFVDYTHTTLYDDLRMTGVLGEGLAAYNDGHRADVVYW
jgi:hypothetical protein